MFVFGAILVAISTMSLLGLFNLAPAGVLLGVVLCILALWLWRRAKNFSLSPKGGDVQLEPTTLEAFLQNIYHLLNLEDEERFVRSALEQALALSGALGATFIPLDEWNHPLRVYAVGIGTEREQERWERSLAQGQIRLACKQCQVYRAGLEQGCYLLQGGVSGAKVVECIPLRQNGRTVAMVNLYLADAGSGVSDNLRHWLEGLFAFVLTGLEVRRLKAREAAIYAQVLGSRLGHPDMESLLRPILWRLMQVAKCEGVALYLGQGGMTTFPIFLTVGQFPFTVPEVINRIRGQISSDSWGAPKQLQPMVLDMKGTSGWVLQLIGSEGKVIGTLLLYPFKAPSWDPSINQMVGLILDTLVQIIETERLHYDLAFRAVMTERSRLAREIHDGLAQTLAYLKLNTAQMLNLLNREDLTRLEAALQQHYQALAEIYLETRQVMDNLRFNPQEDMNAWIHQVATSMAERSNLQIECYLPEKSPELPLEVQAQLLRIIQEALNNIRKHAHASRAWISLSFWNQEWILEIGDNGIGFSPDEVPQFSQHGLRGMRERAELIGAEFQIISRPYQGTVIRLQVPSRVEESLV
ncbi:MAG: sensor histidine kinase [Thermanaerothrix sp.]|nr:sensor histidine kinase [Thermanaerothrix sp.]